VAEHALGMLLTLTRRIAWSNREVIEGDWKRAENTGWELRGACIGIVGYGNTGPAFAEVLQGMGIRLLAHDKYRSGFEGESSLEKIQAEADVISFHLPLAAETKGYADYDFWKGCQRNPWVINTSRGSIMPLDDAYRALQEGLIRGLALDVLDIERSNLEGLSALPDFWNDFMNHPNVLITPHIAGWSSQAFAQMAEILVNRVANVAQC
jgi:D-3-phosphoglycerate dehydrogenase